MAAADLRFDISAVDRTGAAFGKLNQGLTGMAAATTRVTSAAKALSAAFVPLAALGGALAAFRGFKDTVDSLAKVGDVADKVGLTVEQLQELRFAGEQTGVAANQVDMAIQRFSRRIAQAAAGTGELKAIVEANNLQLRNADGTLRPLNDIFRDYAELVRNAGSESDQLLLAFKAFDSEGAALVNTLDKGATGLDDLRVKFEQLGGAVDRESIERISRFSDAWARLTTWIERQFQNLVIFIVEGWDTIANAVEITAHAMGQSIADFLNSDVMQQFLALFGAEGKFVTPPLEIRITKPPELNLPRVPTIIPNLNKQGKEVDKLKDKVDDLTRSSQLYASTFASGLSDLIVRGESFSEVLRRIGERFADQAIQAAISGLFQPQGGAEGGVFAQLGSLFAGFFADGGRIGSGRIGMVGERGPELVAGPATVTPMAGGAGLIYAPTITAGMTAMDRAWLRGELVRSQAEAVRMMERRQGDRLRGRSDAIWP